MARGDVFSGRAYLSPSTSIDIRPASGVEIILFHLAEGGQVTKVKAVDAAGNESQLSLGIFGGNTSPTPYLGDMGIAHTLKLAITNSLFIRLANDSSTSGASVAWFGIQTK